MTLEIDLGNVYHKYYPVFLVGMSVLFNYLMKLNVLQLLGFIKWDKVFKNGPSEICGRQPLTTSVFMLEIILVKFEKNLLKVIYLKQVIS